MKFFKGCLTLIGGFLMLLIVAAIFASNGNKSTTNSGSNGGASGGPTAQTAISINTLVDVRNDRAVEIERSEVMNSIPTGNQFAKSVEAKGGKLTVVYMTLKNIGKESGSMFWTKFQLTDNQGRKYSEIEDFEEITSISMWMKSQGLEAASNQLFPGATAKTAKVFRTSPDAAGLKMIVNDKTFNIQ